MKRLTVICLSLAVCTLTAWAQQKVAPATPSAMENCPLHAQHQADKAKAAHLAEVNRRGAEAMGFSQTQTTHHFRLLPDGGAIEVTANRARDVKSRQQIRRHLQHVALAFAAGDFSQPQHTHAQVPPGVTDMTRLQEGIQYRYEPLPRGGRVRLTTTNEEARQAIHSFLRFQIDDHQTGDALHVAHQR